MTGSGENGGNRYSLASLLSGAGAVAALGIGFLYTIGAVLIAGELRTTGIPLRDALPVIPLPQMLGRGMSVVLSDFVPVLVFVVLGVLGVGYSRTVDRKKLRIEAAWVEIGRELDRVQGVMNEWTAQAAGKEPDEPTDVTVEELDQVKETVHRLGDQAAALPKSEPLRKSWWSRPYVIAVGVVSVLASTPAALPFFLAGQLLVSSHMWLPRRWIGRVQATMAGFALILFSLLVTAYYYPRPLPSVTLERADAPRVTGKLIAQTGNDFFLVVSRNMTVVPHAEVESAMVKTGKSRSRPIIGDKLWYWIT